MMGRRIGYMMFFSIVSVSLLLAFLMKPIPHFEIVSSAYAEDRAGDKRSRRRDRKQRAASRPIEDKVVGAHTGSKPPQFDMSHLTSSIDAVIVMDSSRSMTRTDPHRLRDQGAKLFTRFLTQGDRVAVLRFDRDTAQVLGFTTIDPNDLKAIDHAIENIAADGNFTDIEKPIKEAFNMLVRDGRPDATKCVVLLSDGKMDPHPSRGTPESLTEMVVKQHLPQYVAKQITLYTLSLSEQADKDLLADFAREADGLNWYAPDVDSIHGKFTDLFLTLKKPQVIPLSERGFEIDEEVSEATFYISKQNKDQALTIVDPKGRMLTFINRPPAVKWYTGELFEFITIKRPPPGLWTLRGVEEAEGFASLLTDLTLDVRWPETNLSVGDKVAIMARLTEKGELFVEPGVTEVVFYKYEIISSKTGKPVASGTLTDDGEAGDIQKGDSIFTGVVKIEEEGEYKAFVTVTAPTFTRQRQQPFSVSAGLITLTVEPPDVFTEKPERFEVKLGGQATHLKGLTVQIGALKKGESEEQLVELNEIEGVPGAYDALTSALPAGHYEVTARVSGTDSKKKKITGASATLKFESTTAEVVEEPEEPEEQSSPFVWGLVSTILALLWAGGLAFFSIKRFNVGGSKATQREAYTMPEALTKQIETIRKRGSEERRSPNEKDAAIFADAGITIAVSKGAASEESADDATSDEESAEDSVDDSVDESDEEEQAAEA